MSQLLRGLPALLLLFALLKPIVCGNHELPKSRRERSSYMDTSQYITEHYSGIVEDKRNVHRSRKLLQEQPAYQYPEYEQRYPSYPPHNPPRNSPFLPQYPQPYAGVYGPAFPQPYPQPYSNQYHQQYAPLRQTHQPHYQSELEPRRSSSSSIDDNLFKIFEVGPERLKLFNNTSINPHLSHKLPEQALTDDSSPTLKVKKSTTVNDTISNIFRFGPKPFELFNNTSVNSELSHMQADQAIFNDPSSRVQPFKVQRAPDGKLNLVFNDNLFFQSTSTQPTVHRHPISPPKRAQSNEDDSRYGVLCTSRSKSLCTNATNYPEPRELEALFRENNIGKYEAFFGEDSLPLPNITQRMNGDPEDEELCVSKKELVYPKAGQSKDANWFFIVNTDEIRQGVVIQNCIEKDAPCNSLIEPKLGYKTVCRQHYIFRKMVAITNDKKNITLEDVMLPACCSCVVKQTGLY